MTCFPLKGPMLFNSLTFLAFMALVLAVYPRLRFRGQNAFLLAASYYFYGSWDWRFGLWSSVVYDRSRSGLLHHAVDELHALDDLAQELVTVELPPRPLSTAA
jgi:hypothetical protein